MSGPTRDTFVRVHDCIDRHWRLRDTEGREYDIAPSDKRPNFDIDRRDRGEWTTVFTGTLYEVADEAQRLGLVP